MGSRSEELVGILMAFGIDAALPAFDELLCGVLADRFGRRNVLAGGLVLYGLGPSSPTP